MCLKVGPLSHPPSHTSRPGLLGNMEEGEGLRLALRKLPE